MSTDYTGPTFTWGNVDEWVEKGLLSAAEYAGIRRYVETGAVEQYEVIGEEVMPAREQRQGLNFVTIAYYFGAFMILLAYTIFMGLKWGSLGYGGQFSVTLITVLLVGGIGYSLRRGGFPTAGGMLIFAATGIVPLLIFTFMNLTGIWPTQPDYSSQDYADFYLWVRPVWVILEVISMAVALVVLRFVRFPLITLLVAFWAWYLSMDLARWIAGSRQFMDITNREQIVSVVVGAAMLGIGVALQRRTREDYSRWFYLFGHLVLLGNLSALTLEREGILGLVYAVVYLAFVIAGVWLQRPVFVVFGAIGCYGYFSYLAFRTFANEVTFPIVLAVLGVLVVLTAVGYQKFARPWLERRLVGRQLQELPATVE